MASEKSTESLDQHNTDKIDGGEQLSTLHRSTCISEQVMRPETQTLEELHSSKSGGSPLGSSPKQKNTLLMKSALSSVEKLFSSKIGASPTNSPPKQMSKQRVDQKSNISEVDTAEKLISSDPRPTNDDNVELLGTSVNNSIESKKHTLEKQITSYSGDTVLSLTNVTLKPLGTSIMDSIQSENESSEKLESSNSEDTVTAPPTDTNVQDSSDLYVNNPLKQISSKTGSTSDNTMDPIVATEIDSKENCEFPSEHEEESVINSDANSVLSTQKKHNNN
jgi:hypothetical protein